MHSSIVCKSTASLGLIGVLGHVEVATAASRICRRSQLRRPYKTYLDCSHDTTTVAYRQARDDIIHTDRRCGGSFVSCRDQATVSSCHRLKVRDGKSAQQRLDPIHASKTTLALFHGHLFQRITYSIDHVAITHTRWSDYSHAIAGRQLFCQRRRRA